MEPEKIGFIRGFVYAVAQFLRLEPTSPEEMWRESGFSQSDLGLCDEYDAKEIRKHIKEWDR